MKYRKEWFFGKDRPANDGYVTDYISAYIAENGRRIEVMYTSNAQKYYEVDGNWFDTLREAREYIEES